MNTAHYNAARCTVSADRAAALTVTTFPDGTTVPACPHDTDEYRENARRHGYGDDTAALSREHEVCHLLLALRRGQPYSPTLWAVAHGFGPGTAPLAEQYAEEGVVLAFQSSLNGLPAADCLSEFPDLAAMREAALALLRAPGKSAVTLRADWPRRYSRPRRAARLSARAAAAAPLLRLAPVGAV